jgi:hypothetical protein
METKEVIKMLEGFSTLDAPVLKEAIARTIQKNSGVHPYDFAPCSGNTGCTPTSQYGDCEVVHGACVWIPFFG